MKQHSVHLDHMKSNHTEVLFTPDIVAGSAPAAIGLIRFDDVKCGRGDESSSFQNRRAEIRSWQALEGVLMSTTASLHSWSKIIIKWQQWVKRKRYMQMREKKRKIKKNVGKNVLKPQNLSIIKYKIVDIHQMQMYFLTFFDFLLTKRPIIQLKA